MSDIVLVDSVLTPRQVAEIERPYLKRWWTRRTPETIGSLPWLHPAVVAYMAMLVEPSWKILEHGSGGSTVWFSAHAMKVDSAEHSTDWAVKVAELGLENVDVFPGGKPEQFVGGEYDLLLIDGDPVTDRSQWINMAPALVKSGGIVILDNSVRDEYRKERAELQALAAHWVSFIVNPPGHEMSVTDFYRMKGGEVEWI